jgi:ABC-type transport system involved in Fe-S cluster assembly fused permease/ATPase subunit
MNLRNIIIASMLLNAGLLIGVLGWMPFFLYISLIANIVLVWYTLQLNSFTEEFRADMSSVFSSIINMENHIIQVYEMEMFYGDETLEGLLNHTRSVADYLNFYNDKYNSSPDDEEIIIEEEEDAETAKSQ